MSLLVLVVVSCLFCGCLRCWTVVSRPGVNRRFDVVLYVFCGCFAIANALPMLFLSYPIQSYPILTYPILTYPILSYAILTNPILSYPILSYPTLPYPILSYSNLSYPILSYRIEFESD